MRDTWEGTDRQKQIYKEQGKEKKVVLTACVLLTLGRVNEELLLLLWFYAVFACCLRSTLSFLEEPVKSER